jgi:hypothetical protein
MLLGKTTIKKLKRKKKIKILTKVNLLKTKSKG